MTKKVILITWASSGMWKETALDLIEQWHIVYGAARSLDKMQDLVKAGWKALSVDMADEKTIETLVESVIKEEWKIDVLWNNAGFWLYGPVEEISIDDARYQYEVNIFGLAKLTQLVTPYMRKEWKGTIINTSSMWGKIYTPLWAWYHSTKHALEWFSDCLRLELKPFGIDVVIIEPGIIKTEFGNVVLEKLVEKHGSGPYEKLVHAMNSATEESYSKSNSGSPSSVISQTITIIINAKNPKKRYVVWKLAKPMIFLRKWFGDTIYEKVLMSIVK